MNVRAVTAFFNDLIDRHPGVGYVGAIMPTAAGFLAFVETAYKIGAFVSVVIGIAVGLVTLQVQLKHKRRLEAEERARTKA
jgi:hypothetical protein